MTSTLYEGTSTWVNQSTRYYVRSSVMNGRVVSEVLSNAKKYRTYIKGIGNQTGVQQAYVTESAQLDELVLFEFSDASGMSYRTTDKVGVAAATGDGGEGSPIEIDPLGGSVGLFTPYIQLSGGTYTPRYPDVIQPYNTYEDSGPNFSSIYSTYGSRTADLPGFGTNWGSFADFGETQYSERVQNSRDGLGFLTNEEAAAAAAAFEAAHAGQDGEPGHEGGREGSGESGSQSTGDGGWVDQSTATVDLEK